MRVDARPMPLQPNAPMDAAQIDKVARDMEGLFAQMMIKQMRETALGDTMFPGAASQFRELYDEQIAKSLTEGKGLGLSTMIVRQLSQQAGLDDPKAALGALPLSLAGNADLRMLPLDTYARPFAAKPLVRDAEMRPLALTASNGVAVQGKARVPADIVPRIAPGLPNEAPDKAAAVAPVAAGSNSSRVDAFVAKVWPHAQRVGRELGVDPRAIVAQAALETGWGRSTISSARGGEGATANNYFGIKATGAWRGDRVSTNTQEFVDGAFRTERAAFRAYDGVEQSFADYAALLKRSPRYAEALGSGSDIRRFAGALQRSGYATDPTYARKIESIATGPTLERALARLDIDNATGPAAPAMRNTMFAAGGIGGL